MVRYCCVPQCKNKHAKGLKLHRFPQNIDLKKKWIVAIKSGKKHSASAVVCSDHFCESDYLISSSGKIKLRRVNINLKS